jgi:hypothetical protein
VLALAAPLAVSVGYGTEGRGSCRMPRPANTTFVSVGDDIQNKIDTASSGTALLFAPGTYTLTNVNLKSDISLIARSSHVTFKSGDAGHCMLCANKVKNIWITGITFDGNGGVTYPNGVFSLNGARSVHIANDVFKNNPRGSDVVFNDVDDFYFQGNTSGNLASISEAQPISGKNTRGSHGNIFITDNSFTGFRRMAIELQVPSELPFAGSWHDVHIDRNAFSHWDHVRTGTYWEAVAISFVARARASGANNTVWDNTMNGTSGYKQWAIEIATPHTSIFQNRVVDTDYPIFIGSSRGVAIENNDMSSFRGPHPFNADGGYDGKEWIGTNTWDGASKNGWPGRVYGPRPAIYGPAAPCGR